MTLETAIKAVIGHTASDETVVAVGMQLAREGKLPEPMPGAIMQAAGRVGV